MASSGVQLAIYNYAACKIPTSTFTFSLVQAVKTYTHCLKDIDEGRLEKWQSLSPPEFSRYYWGLGEDATMRDLIMAVSPLSSASILHIQAGLAANVKH